jgi:hypothetical protein
MTMGLVGRKCGMTRVFTEEGDSIPVTVIEAQPNRVTQVKTVENDGYRALQVTAGSKKASHVSKPRAGQFAAAKVDAGDLAMEFRLDERDKGEFAPGSEIRVDQFKVGQRVDVIGTSTILRRRMRPTATRCRIARPARSDKTSLLAACSKASGCPVTWVTYGERCKTSKSCASIQTRT